MHLKSKEYENQTAGIIQLLSMYQALYFEQISRFYPELSAERLHTIIRHLEKSGRLIYRHATGILLYSADCSPEPAVLAAFWILLDFRDELVYHTIGTFPVTLTFYAGPEAYDVVYVPPEKEMLINHALSALNGEPSRRLVVVESGEQIPLLDFPDIAAYCMVTADGQVNYFKKQGVTDS